MRFFAPALMDNPEETDKSTFLRLILKKRPEYVIVWDVHGKDMQEFHKRVWVCQYVAIVGDTVYYSQSRHYATRAKVLYNLENIVHIESDDQWEQELPAGRRFKPIKYFAPSVVEIPEEIALEDFINKMLAIRPKYAVIWGLTLKDLEYIVSRVYVVSFMLVIEDTLYYSFAKHFAYAAQKMFQVPHRKQISIQTPEI
ncbi:hypothetical protein [Candidatus Lokiarchaeum ossiferum]|uniref:hypothetical protein n=1 Tax=Candidatus Lokiarchaeum ossiferum TaxID=2951803 RepID=UPI00352E3C86